MSSIDEQRLIKLKQFIIDKISEEQLNPIIITDFRIEVPVKTVREIFNFTASISLELLNKWLSREFPNKQYSAYMEDRPNSDVYIRV
jgi:hypothetical protein